jgi:predicted secreted protein
MAITSAIVLFAVIWFMLFLMILPMRLRTQGEEGDIVPGTHSSAPENPQIKRKAKITTLITVVLWAIIFYIIVSGTITVRDLDWFGRMG